MARGFGWTPRRVARGKMLLTVFDQIAGALGLEPLEHLAGEQGVDSADRSIRGHRARE